MYTVPSQPDTPDDKKTIIKTENVVREKHLIIYDLLWEHDNLLVEIDSCKQQADDIVDELIEINKILPVGDIPAKFNKEKR